MQPVSNESLLAAQISGSSGAAKAVAQYQTRQREVAQSQQVQRSDTDSRAGRREAPVDKVEIRFPEGQAETKSQIRLEAQQQERRAEDDARDEARREDNRRYDREAPRVSEQARSLPPGSQLNISV